MPRSGIFPHMLIQYPGDKKNPAGPQFFILIFYFFFAFEHLLPKKKKKKKKTLPHKSGEKLSNSTGSFGSDEVLAKRVSMETNMLLRLKTHRVAFWTERGKKPRGAEITSAGEET